MTQDIPDIFKNISPAAGIETDYLQHQADKVISSLMQTYTDNVRIQIQDIFRYIEEAHFAKEVSQITFIRDSLFRTAHDIKGQGTTFGYPLLTEIGAVICDKIRPLTVLNASLLDILEQLATEMKTVISFPPHTQNSTLSGIAKRVQHIKETL